MKKEKDTKGFYQWLFPLWSHVMILKGGHVQPEEVADYPDVKTGPASRVTKVLFQRLVTE